MKSICDVPGIRVGHAEAHQAKTGCSVILPEKAVIAGVDVRGSAPGTREIELLKPVRLVQRVHAILLTGGSAFGLDAAGGVQQYLEEHDIGFDTGAAKIPIVPTAVLYDLTMENPKIRPDKRMGYQAAKNAIPNNCSTGQIGAGAGATVGKFMGIKYATAGGIGMWSMEIGDGIIVAAFVVVNAFGNIYDPWTNSFVAGACDQMHKIINPLEQLNCWITPFSNATNTTLGVIATNAILSKEECIKVAQMAHDGFARTIIPSHTMVDGDMIFAMSTESIPAKDPIIIGSCAAEVMARAVISSVS